MAQLTYHPFVHWGCTHCSASGDVTRADDEACDTVWPRIVADHIDQSPACDEKYGHGGLWTKSEQVTLPE